MKVLIWSMGVRSSGLCVELNYYVMILK